jgi:hypothetical protein
MCTVFRRAGPLVASWLVLVLAGGAAAPDKRLATPPAKTDLMKPETRKAIAAGLSYLKSQQNEDGSFGTRHYARNVGVCSLAGLAFMCHGSTPRRGPYGREVDRCTSYLLNNTRDSGLIACAEAASHGPMYEHGFATLLLAEVYGMHSDPAVREKLTRAVKLIVASQNDEGGWRYEPKRQDADISVTVCEVMALRAARNAGIYVPKETIDRCVDYVKRCQNADGGFLYMLSSPGESSFPRSAGGVVALHSAGVYNTEEVERGLAYLMKHLPGTPAGANEQHYFYGQYYAVQAFWQAGGERWQRWYSAIQTALLARQQPTGSWFDQVSPEYGTAMACIILQMPHNYLPIFQH